MRATTLLASQIHRAVLLCLTAGYVDAYGYVDHGGVFAANMTGNTVLLGIAATRQEWAHSLPYALTLGAFFLGAMATAAVKRVFNRGYLSLLVAAALLAVAERLGLGSDLVLLLLAFAMGLQGGTLNRFGGGHLQTVVVTSTLLNLADGCVPRAARHGDAPSQMPLLGAGWLAYAGGAATSVLVSGRIGIPLVPPALALLLVALDLARERRGTG